MAIAYNGTLLAPAQKMLNFAGAGVGCVVNIPFARVDCTIPGGGGGVSDGSVVVTQPPYNAACDGVTNDTAAIEAAMDSGAPRIVIPGSCAVCSLDLRQSNQVLAGIGPQSILLGTPACVNTVLIGNDPTHYTGAVSLEDLQLRAPAAGGTNLVSINGRSARDVAFRRVTFDLSGTGIGIGVQGLDGLTVEDSAFIGDASTSASMTIQRGSRVRVSRCGFDFTQQGIIVSGAADGASRALVVEDSEFENLWWMQPTAFTGSGGTVSYVDNGTHVVLTDTAAAFAGLAAQDVVRVLPVRQTGVVDGNIGTRLDDAAATFITNSVAENDLVYTATAWARVIAAPVSETQVYTTGWRSRTTYRPVQKPVGVAYTVYRVLIGHVASSTPTTINLGATTFQGLHDMLGTDIVGAPPVPAGTLYEVTTINPNYFILTSAGVNDVRIIGNRFFGTWADQVGLFGDRGTIMGNLFAEGQDGGLTLTGTRNTVTGNVVRRNGATGIYMIGAGNTVVGNELLDNVWVNGVGTDLGDIRPSSDGIIADNVILRTNANQPLSVRGVAVRSTASGLLVSDNTISGHATESIKVIAGAANVQLLGNVLGGIVTDAGTNTIRMDSASGVTTVYNPLQLANAQPLRLREPSGSGSNYVAMAAVSARADDIMLDWGALNPANCTGGANGGALTLTGAGPYVVTCTDDDGGVGGGNSFTTMDASSGTDPVADVGADTLIMAGTAPIVVTGDAGADSLTFSLTQNAGTDVTADLEEETHAGEHSLGGGDAITVTNLGSGCTDAQVLGGTLAGTGVECQADDDVPDTGEVTDGALANNYSGVGSCTNQFVRAVNDNAAPTCADVALGTDTSGNYVDSITANQGILLSGAGENKNVGLIDCAENEILKSTGVGGTSWACAADQVGGGGMTSFFVSADAGATLTVSNAETLKISGGTDLTCTGTAGSPETVTCDADSALSRDNEAVNAAGTVAGNLAAGYTLDDDSVTPNQLADTQTLDANLIWALGNFGMEFQVGSPSSPAIDFSATGNLGQDLVHIHQHTGNPTAGSLLSLEAEDPDYQPLEEIRVNAAGATANPVVGLRITTNDNDDASFIPFQVQDDSGGTPDTIFQLGNTGSFTMGEGNAASLTQTFDPSGATNPVWTASDGILTFSGGDLRSVTPAVDDNDTSVATTAFVQAESVAAGNVTGTIGGGLTVASLDLDAGATVTGIVDDQLIVGTGAGTTGYVTLQNCNDVTEKLDWTGAAFACVMDQTGAGGGVSTIKEDNANVTTSATAIDFAEPDAVIVSGATGESEVDLSGYARLLGRASTPQTLSGGPDAGDALTLRGSSNANPDGTTGFLTGSSIQLTETGKAVPIWLARGNQTINGTFSHIAVSDGYAPFPLPGEDQVTYTMQAATCTADASMNALCDAVDSPWVCCTGAATGNCGYCNGSSPSGIGIDCDTTGVGGEDPAVVCAPGYGYFSEWWHTLDFAADGNPVEATVLFVLAPTITGSGGGSRSLGASGLFDFIPTYQIPNGTNLTQSRVDGLFYGPRFTRPAGTSTGTTTDVRAIYFTPNVSAGWTVTNMTGLSMPNPTNAGTITNLGAVDVADLTAGDAGGQTFAIRSAISAAANRSFLRHTGTAKSNIGGPVRIAADTTAPTAMLEVKQAANAVGMTLNTTGTQTADTNLLRLGTDGITLGTGGALTGVTLASTYGGTITLTDTTNVLGSGNFFYHAPKWQTDGSARTMTGTGSYVSLPIFDSNGAALTMNANIVGGAAAVGFFASPAFTRSSGAATQTAANWVGVQSGATNTAVNSNSAGWTVTDWRGFWYNEPSNAGTITTQTGLDIPALSVGSEDYPILIGEHTIDADAVPANKAVIGIETGAPGVLYVASEDESVRRLRGTAPATVRLGALRFDMGSGNSITTSDEWVFRLQPFAASITTIGCEAYAGTSFTINVCAGEDMGDDTCATGHLSGTITCDTTGVTGTVTNPTVSANAKVTIVVTAVSGTVTKGEIYIDGSAT